MDWSQKPPRLPTVPGQLQATEDKVEDIVNKLDRLPLGEIGDNVRRSLVDLDLTLVTARSTLTSAHGTLVNTDDLTGPNSAQLQATRQHTSGSEPRRPLGARAGGLSRAPSRGASARQKGGSKVMAGRGLYSIAADLAAVAAFGCSTAPSRFYTLDSTATPSGAQMAHIAVTVGPVSIPAAVDQPQFVVQVASNRVEIDEFNRWAAPLGDNIARVVAGDLTVQLGTPNVAAAPFANFDPTYTVTIEVQRFDSIRGEAALDRSALDRAQDGKRGNPLGSFRRARGRAGRRLRRARRCAQPRAGEHERRHRHGDPHGGR